ncbi:crossover junction endodeoxyribonuclease RuvC [Candidatus Dojkabacteria bacterium]|nr:crossover junction endodeoxyribonuclease RuvC [Candidatus Dojkabacteria bacterium]
MRVLGIDCGIAITGWAVLERLDGIGNKAPDIIDYGVIRTDSGQVMSHRLSKLYEEVIGKINLYKPESAAIESLFYFRNQKTVMSVGQARGVIILACAHKDLPTHDYTPLQVKQAVVGYGKAEKKQVQRMIKLILKLEETPKPDDAADALAVALCHLNSFNGRR